MRGVGVGVLCLCAVLTQDRAQVWRTDLTLWTAAVQTAPTPRAQVNYAGALIRTGQVRTGALVALEAARQSPDDWRVQQVVREQIRWAALFEPLCDRPPFRPYCS